MAVSNAKTLALVGLAVFGAGRTDRVVAAQPRVQQEIVLDAQSADADLANNNEIFRKVRITQGDMSIAADMGQGTQQKVRVDFDNSLWIFRGNVKIMMDHAQLTSDDAQINFVKQELSKVVVNGKPAAFEQRVAKTGKLAQGHADNIDYDAGKGLVRLNKNAWLSDGQTEIHGESLKYNMVAQSIVAEASEQGSQRVHIVIAPPSKP
jgi:lipopolysaccharide transport protein LptA